MWISLDVIHVIQLELFVNITRCKTGDTVTAAGECHLYVTGSSLCFPRLCLSPSLCVRVGVGLGLGLEGKVRIGLEGHVWRQRAHGWGHIETGTRRRGPYASHTQRQQRVNSPLCLGGTFQATAGFEESDLFQKTAKMVLKCFWVWILTFQDSDFNLVPPMFM